MNRTAIADLRAQGAHRVGTPILPGESIEQWAQRAGLGWEAKKTPVLFATGATDLAGDPIIHSVADRAVLSRSDNNFPLGIVSDRFKTFQPADVVSFYDDLVKRHNFTLTDAGTFKGGKIVWVKAETGDVMRVRGNDVLKGYVLLSTSFDGSLATTARFSTLRLICMNGLTVGEDLAPVVRVSHRSIFDADATKVKLGVGDAFVRFQQQAELMAEKTVSHKQAIEYFLAVYHDMKAESIVTKQAEKATDKTIARLAQHFIAAPGADLRSASGTVWGLLNAVTYDIDHARKARNDESRACSALFGDGERVKNKARNLALELAA
jgi:phage/plasmid-like protein (TIGR03299 family)